MQLPVIEMPRAEARKKFLEYKREVEARHDAELAAIMRGYKALASGHQVLALTDAIRRGGVAQVPRGEGLATVPRLAVCRADEVTCALRIESSGAIIFTGFKPEERDSWNRPRHRSEKRRVRLPAKTMLSGNFLGGGELEAMVPVVPPPLRPRAALSNYHVLWEAEWKQPQRLVPPGDPALLRHIGGDLYAVVAMWDLTELERAVLAGTRG